MWGRWRVRQVKHELCLHRGRWRIYLLLSSLLLETEPASRLNGYRVSERFCSVHSKRRGQCPGQKTSWLECEQADTPRFVENSSTVNVGKTDSTTSTTRSSGCQSTLSLVTQINLLRTQTKVTSSTPGFLSTMSSGNPSSCKVFYGSSHLTSKLPLLAQEPLKKLLTISSCSM